MDKVNFDMLRSKIKCKSDRRPEEEKGISVANSTSGFANEKNFLKNSTLNLY